MIKRLFLLLLPLSLPVSLLHAQNNVGIGTVTPAEKLEVEGGTIQINDGSGGAYRLPFSDGANNQTLETDGSGNVGWATPTGGSSIWTDAGSYIYYDSLISVNQTGAAAQAMDIGGWLELGNETFGGTGTAGAIRYNGSAGNGVLEFHDGSSWQSAGGDGDWTISPGAVYNTADNIGIGTNNPSEKLELLGALGFTPGTDRRVYVRQSAGAGHSLTIEAGQSAFGTTDNGGDLMIQSGEGDGSGRAGDVIINAGTGTNTGDILFVPSTINQVGIHDGFPTHVLELPNNTSNTVGRARAFAWDTYSSRRWKRNIEPLPDGTGYTERLRPVEFDWQASAGGHHDIGFIAEEVNEVLPSAVTMAPHGRYAQGMAYAQLTPVLVKTAQEQQALIKKLKQHQARLRNQVEALEAAAGIWSDTGK